MNTPIELLKQKIAKMPGTGNERSLYPALCNFFEEYGKDICKLRSLQAIAEESLSKEDKNIGFPDITIRNGEELIGWVEVKNPSEDLTSEKFKMQFDKYKDSLENVMFTNMREWQLWQWTKDEGENSVESKIVGRAIFDVTKIDGTNTTDFENFLAKFFEGRVHETRTPKQLALALAKKTRLLSKQVEEALDGYDDHSDLWQLKETFEKTLIQDIAPHQFANMVAETLAYSLFLAALEHSRRGNETELTLTSAIDYLPTNVPVLADLYSLIKKVATTIPSIAHAARLLVDQLNAADIERIRMKLVEHKPGEDPVIQFYEPFLAEYDPKEREARGVYYTPKPVVDYIVKSVHEILRSKFNKTKGLADESVHLLDPATGTGTFLMSSIQQIYLDIKKENATHGDEMVQKAFNDIVLRHILKHFYGFELLIAPYAIAHLKLTLEVERLGFDFALTHDDGDKDNDRFKIYLANTLDDPNQPPAKLFVGYDAIPKESEKAREIKKSAPILAIIGNPPYSNFGRMNRGEWILNLLKDYKKGLKEKKINIDDDFIKFIRFAQWKLEQTGQGIFAMITSNTFIDGITHRQMRRSLMDTFDEIYIYNLHGNSRKGEIAPDGGKDENVFNIQQGVSINVFVKYPEKQNETIVKYCDLWGLREHKFVTLLDEDFKMTNWKALSPKEPNWYFVEKNGNDEYSLYQWSLDKIFTLQSSGVKTERDNITIHDSVDALKKVMDIFLNTSDAEVIRARLSLPKDSRDWSVVKAQRDLVTHKDKMLFRKVLYRPFDIKNTFYTGTSRGFIGTPGSKVGYQMIRENLGLCLMRQYEYNCEYCYFLVTSLLTESRIFISNRGIANIAPLYLYKKSEQGELLGSQTNREPNLSPNFVRALSEKVNLAFVYNGRGDLEKTFGPEDIFYYAYAIFHSPTYRLRYAEQLKIDFPRLPLTSDKKLFAQLVRLGNELVNLHLLGENPFDKSKTIFDEPEKWDVKIGGAKPENLDDWKVAEVRYDEKEKRVYVNAGQYFEGAEKEVWEFIIGGYQVCEKWLKDRKKAERALSTDDLKHYMKIVVSLRETIRVMKEIDEVIEKHGGWPIK